MSQSRVYTETDGTFTLPGLGAPGTVSEDRPTADRRNGAGAALPLPLPKGGPGGFTVRALNVAIAATALILLSPLLAAIAVAIKLTSPGPVLYTQTRVGMDRRGERRNATRGDRRVQDLGGRPFRMYKFRTMRTDAEDRTGPVWARPNDGRVTRVGRWLRRYRLDELPQLWNVVRGDMNITGPRPERPALVAYLSGEVEGYVHRHKVRPGITGWAQVNQSYDTTLQSVRTKLLYDLDYIQRRSMLFDLYVMFRTPPAVFRKKTGW